VAEEADEQGEAVAAALSEVVPQVSQRQVVHRGFALLRVRPIQAFLVTKNKD
jgi:hypothetical protein